MHDKSVIASFEQYEVSKDLEDLGETLNLILLKKQKES